MEYPIKMFQFFGVPFFYLEYDMEKVIIPGIFLFI